MMVMLGAPLATPLLRMNAVRRLTSPASSLADGSGRDHEAERGEGDDPADRGADTEGRELEKCGARIALGLRHAFLVLGELRDGLGLRLGLRDRPAHFARRLADPDEAEDERDRGADCR